MRRVILWSAVIGIGLALVGCGGGGGPVDAGEDAGADGFDGGGDPGGDELGPPPVLTAVEPAEGPTAGGTAVVLHGSGFAVGARVRFGAATADDAEVQSAAAIACTTPPGSPGPVAVRVTNPDGQWSELAAGFDYQPPVQPGDCPRQTGCEPAEALFQLSTGNPTDSVLLAGEFTGWRDGAIPMQGDGAGNFSARVYLAEGRYEYKFVVNDSDWRNDPAAGDPEPIFGNSVRLHDNPCTPDLVPIEPAYGQVFGSADVTLVVEYRDAAAGAGIDPDSICLVVDGLHRSAGWNSAGSRIEALLEDLSEGDHHWWISAADGQAHRSAELQGFFTVDVVGELPLAGAGPTQFAYPGEWVVLDASWSRDPDGLALLEYRWTQTAGPAVTLEPQHETPFEGYRPDGMNPDPCAEPRRTDARMGFAPPSTGVYRFELEVRDDDGWSAAPAVAEVVVLTGPAGAPPAARVGVTPSGTGVTLTARSSGAGSFSWRADAANPAPVTLPTGAALSLGATDLPVEGTYFFYAVPATGGVEGRPATAQVRRLGNTLEAWDYDAPPDWLPDAQIYEIYVRSFADSDGDGIGDLPGLTAKLDYLDDLGVNTLWLMPVFESADHAHGYHTVNYFRVERDYGTNDDLRDLLLAAHSRGMRVVLDLVINHTSRQHPLFQAAAFSPGSRFRDHYIWFQRPRDGCSDDLLWTYGFGRELGGSRLTVESGWGDIPDVNFSNPVARDRFFEVARYWMDPDADGDFSDGVDGLRLDHVTGPAHLVWRDLRRELKTLRPDLLLLAEVFRDFDNNGQGYGIKDYYRGEFDLAFTFPFYWVAHGVLKSGEAVGGCAEPCGLDWLMAAIAQRFDPDAVMCFFIENHDVPWYSTAYEEFSRSEGKMLSAAALMQTLPNSPQLLYGQELGTEHWRGAMPWVKDTPDNDLKRGFRDLMRLRRDHAVLRRGGFVRLAVSGPATDVYAFARTGSSETIVVVVNTRGYQVDGVSVDLAPLGSSAGELTDLLDGRSWPVSGGQLSSRSLGAYERWVGTLGGS